MELSLDLSPDIKLLKLAKGFSEDRMKKKMKIAFYQALELIRGRIVKNISGAILRVRSGHLRNSFNIGDGNNIYDLKATKEMAYGRVGSNVKYASIHETGGVIEPKNSSALRFKYNGEWVTVKKVVMPARKYMSISLDMVEHKLAGIITRELMKL